MNLSAMLLGVFPATLLQLRSYVALVHGAWRETAPFLRRLCCFLLRRFRGLVRLGGLGVLALMEGQAGLAEVLSAQIAALGMS
jgi:hypothetical protein